MDEQAELRAYREYHYYEMVRQKESERLKTLSYREWTAMQFNKF